jgi:hypothetical protein
MNLVCAHPAAAPVGCQGVARVDLVRDGQGQPRAQPGQPALLGGDDLRAEGAARQPPHQLIPDPVRLPLLV